MHDWYSYTCYDNCFQIQEALMPSSLLSFADTRLTRRMAAWEGALLQYDHCLFMPPALLCQYSVSVCVLAWRTGRRETVFGFSPHQPKAACKLRAPLSTTELRRAWASCSLDPPLPSLPSPPLHSPQQPLHSQTHNAVEERSKNAVGLPFIWDC